MVKGEPGNEQEVKPEGTRHELTIQFANNVEALTIKVKGTVRFEKVYKAVADHSGKAPGSFRLNVDGARIQPNDTPNSLDMNETEVIDVFEEVVGGAGRA